MNVYECATDGGDYQVFAERFQAAHKRVAEGYMQAKHPANDEEHYYLKLVRPHIFPVVTSATVKAEEKAAAKRDASAKRTREQAELHELRSSVQEKRLALAADEVRIDQLVDN